ncbi:CinA family nicotinamide mononucleotide deamidase-related protein [Aquimarina sp. BL5]|uniref:CinA family nicotinamide mononucleotide deamidase-related protein n=1 Tax=Aquimarina sp. BL5 TaxID=1714860 RepID=UPI000E469AD7|nr:CinA family nicotinamide mononucleotide deamidase-related protein [Aquimarina sp. BL5]AXT53327.1 CinA family nicotinamide mononucleotide deamidase-related protein [Aquimarina sp. BL5]RKN02750.1 CinA family nicotinamide mononucleotide deamidase-related protein [Aquimarina sp. BL5]
MLAEIITIGDEILIGQIVDSNSAFIGKELNKIGIDVYQITSIQDDKQHILDALEEAKNRVDIVLVTGGLGPTKDDITKHTICEFFDDTLVENDKVLQHIETLFAKYIHTPVTDINRMQALVPSTSTVLMNSFGTAPGMWLEKENTVFVSMPGVPFEMKNLMKDEVLPRLQEKFDRPFIIHKTVLTYGLGESAIAKKIEQWEDDLPSFIKLAYLPNLGRVRLRLSARGIDEKLLIDTIENKIADLHAFIGDIIVGYEEDESIELMIGKILASRGQFLAVAESCTGGKISQSITAYAGSSSFFKGGAVTYATQSKTDLLGVDRDLIKQYTVTSNEVAKAMALGVKNKFKSDYAIATTGNAGPSKGDGDVEVGTVFIAIATPDRVFSEKFVFSNLRERTIGKAVNKSFEMLFNEIT